METNNINFVEAKMAFIREFMNSTRPATELEEFIKAFDTCIPAVHVGWYSAQEKENPIRIPGEEKEIAPAFPSPYDLTKEELPSARLERRIKAKKVPVIHSGNRPNVHPRAKMVKVTFMDRINYYGSMTAAAVALNVTYAQVKYAIKHHKTINGQEVEFTNSDKLKEEFSKTK